MLHTSICQIFELTDNQKRVVMGAAAGGLLGTTAMKVAGSVKKKRDADTAEAIKKAAKSDEAGQSSLEKLGRDIGKSMKKAVEEK